MWYKKDRETLVFEVPIEKKEGDLFHLLHCGTISPINSAVLYLNENYIGIISNFTSANIVNDGVDFTIVSDDVIIHVDKIEILFAQKDMQKVMEMLQ